MTDLVPVQMFKAQKQSRRFRKNQKVWISNMYANHLAIRFKWRGKGRFVSGTISKFQDEAPAIGEFKTIEVARSFARMILDECTECGDLWTHDHYDAASPHRCSAPRVPWTPA